MSCPLAVLTQKNSKPMLLAKAAPSQGPTAILFSKSILLATTTPVRGFPWFCCLIPSSHYLRRWKVSGLVTSQTNMIKLALPRSSNVISLNMFYPAMSIKCNSTLLYDFPSMFTSLTLYSQPQVIMQLWLKFPLMTLFIRHVFPTVGSPATMTRALKIDIFKFEIFII